MIARKYLIPLRKEFLEIKKNGKFVNSQSFSVIITKNNFDYPRFAVIVGKKNFKLSVTRHKIKRQVADAISKRTFPNNDYVFILKKEPTKDEINNLILN